MVEIEEKLSDSVVLEKLCDNVLDVAGSILSFQKVGKYRATLLPRWLNLLRC